MRTMMAAGGVGCPWFRAFTTDQDPRRGQQAPYPCVVKPADLNGSRTRADTPDESAASQLAGALARGGSAAGALHVSGGRFHFSRPEAALEGLLTMGAHRGSPFDKPDPLDGPFFEETIYVTPSRFPTMCRPPSPVAWRTPRARKLRNRPGPRRTAAQQRRGPWMLEVAGRSIGGLCSERCALRCGCVPGGATPASACGPPLPSTQRRQRQRRHDDPHPAAGVLQRVDGVDAARAVPGIEGVEITAKLHYGLTPLPEGDAYLGFIFARGDAPATVEDALRLAHRQLHFTILPEFSLDA
ncbi:MAG: hypothetical protein R3A10_09665 [Caldilineaceae bacterium]